MLTFVQTLLAPNDAQGGLSPRFFYFFLLADFQKLQFLVSHANFLSKKFNLSPRSQTTKFVRSIVAFSVSGFIHIGGEFMIFHNLKGGSFVFFVLQAFAIIFEEMILYVWRILGLTLPQRIFRLAGYVWVTLWFAYTLPIMLEPLLRNGFFESGPSFSVILGVWQGEWVPTV